jgi:hypothetical protein
MADCELKTPVRQARRAYCPRLPVKAQKNAIERPIIIKSVTLEMERLDILIMSSA